MIIYHEHDHEAEGKTNEHLIKFDSSRIKWNVQH